MSNLTVGLAILGGLILAAVVAHSTWTSRRNAPKLPQPETLPPDVPANFIEPTLDGSPPEPQPVSDSVQDAALMPPSTMAGYIPDRRGGLDALIDLITPVQLDALVSGEAVLAHQPPTRRAGGKPFAIEGLNTATRQWDTLAHGQRYSALQVGVQLANRTGALNEIEFSEFVVKIQAFCDAINATPEFPDMLDAVASARELDQFASAHDAQLSFTLRARHAAWSPGYVQQHAARLGFVAGALPGRMVLPVISGGAITPMLGLSFDTQAALSDDPAQSAIRQISLSLDVPQVDRQEQAFKRMREVAAALAQAMDGAMVDDDGRMIQPESLDGIADDLEQLYDALDARELSAGSPVARRLFS